MKWPRRRRDEPDLTRAWRDIDYAVVDLETTGLDLHRDSIASYGVVLVEGGRILPRDTYGLVRPSSPMTPEAITVHALLPADVADAPPVSHAVQVIESALADRVLVAHAAWVERSFLTRAFAATGRRLRCRIIDTAAMARAAHMRCARGPSAWPRCDRPWPRTAPRSTSCPRWTTWPGSPPCAVPMSAQD